MKKLTFILMAVAGSMAMVGCSSDDDKGGSQDCFDCSFLGIDTRYCYTEGNDFYTVTVMGQSENASLEGASWDEVKEGLQMICP